MQDSALLHPCGAGTGRVMPVQPQWNGVDTRTEVARAYRGGEEFETVSGSVNLDVDLAPWVTLLSLSTKHLVIHSVTPPFSFPH
jgi:hypothetical protein